MRDVDRPRRGAGFSLIELMVVVALIMLLSAISLPKIGQYFRLYKIRSAQQQVASAIQQARNRAIAKNVNNGVDFIVQSPTQYWVHVEDDQTATRSRAQATLAFGSPNFAQSSPFTLPDGVRFAASSAECPSSTLAAVNLSSTTYLPTTYWFQFTRLGSWCSASCASPPYATPPALPAPPSLIMNGAFGSVVCLYQPATRLSRALVVNVGGRVQQEQ